MLLFFLGIQKYKSKNPFTIASTQSANTENMDEILGLCSGQFTGNPTQKPQDTQGDMEELLGLCSGKFATQKETGLAYTQRNMDELLGLCSGKFAGDGREEKAQEELLNDSPVKVKTKKGKAVIVDDEEDGEDSRVSFTIGSDDDEQEADDEGDELGSDEEVDEDKENDKFAFSKGIKKR